MGSTHIVRHIMPANSEEIAAQLAELGVLRLAPAVARAGSDILALNDAQLRELGAACFEVAALRSSREQALSLSIGASTGAKTLSERDRNGEGGKKLAGSTWVDTAGETLSETGRIQMGRQGDYDGGSGMVGAKYDDGTVQLSGFSRARRVCFAAHRAQSQAISPSRQPLLDLIQRFGAEWFVTNICVFFEPVDISRLVKTCTGTNVLTNYLYKQVCDKLGFRQTGSKSRPVPYAQIFTQHLCVECWLPAISDLSICIDLNGGSGRGGTYPAKQAVKWLCGDCHPAIPGKTKSEMMNKGLPNTRRRFGDHVQRTIVYSITD